MDISEIREDFPILQRKVADDTPLVYLDNAATTQTPTQVVNEFDRFFSEYNANIHRGIHTLSHEASVAYEAAHDRLAEFVGADGRAEMVFTKNTTESINLVAYSLGMDELEPETTIVTTEMEHHASLVTWQQIAERTGADIEYIPVTPDGHLDMEIAREKIDSDTVIVSITHVSNVLGTINPVREISDIAHDNDAYVLVDGAQSAPNRPIDVKEIDTDFYTFSGHKMLGPTGIGCLYGKEALLADMEPFLYGGEMITHVTFDDSTWNELPWKFEAGTPPVAEGIALARAVEYLEDIGMERVRAHENELAQYALDCLSTRDDIEVYGPPLGEERSGLVSFNVDGIHGHDISSILDDRGIAIRSGDHCTQPLHGILDITGSARASFYVYNTHEEIDELVAALEDADRKLRSYLQSDRYHPRVFEHHQNPHTDSSIVDPTYTKRSAETSCGDEGEFQIEIGSDGSIERIGFQSESCAVSTAVASILAQNIEGESIEYAASLENKIQELLEDRFDTVRRDCVKGPEDVLRETAREYIDMKQRPSAQ